MELINTLKIDPKDPEHRKKFNSLIKDNHFIVFVVMGNDTPALTIVEKADILADDHQGKIARKVAWMEDRNLLKEDCLNFLKTFPEYNVANYDKTLAYVLSPNLHETKYVFMITDTIDDFAVSKAYWKASLREKEVEIISNNEIVLATTTALIPVPTPKEVVKRGNLNSNSKTNSSSKTKKKKRL